MISRTPASPSVCRSAPPSPPKGTTQPASPSQRSSSVAAARMWYRSSPKLINWGSSHTDPVFVLVDGKPIRASRRSAEWCLKSVDQAWSQKSPLISAAELPEAAKAFEHARQVYRQLISESSDR